VATAAVHERSAAADTGGYPDADATDCSATYGVYSWCKGGTWLSGRGYGYRNCTDFAAWKVQSLGVPDSRTRGLGNANTWDDRAPSNGVAVNGTAVAGSVAISNAGSFGHLAYVSSVSGGTITVQEYNKLGTGTYGTRTGTPDALGFTRFAHFESFMPNPPGGSSPPPPQPGPGVRTAVYRGSQLDTNETLHAGEYLASTNLQYALVMQTDGNLVLYGAVAGLGYRPMWHTNTDGTGADRVIMQPDGNLVVYDDGTPRWWSGTSGSIFHAIVQSDGNFVVYDSANQAQWHSHTGGHPSYTYAGSDRLTTGQILYRGQYLRSADGRYALLLQPDGNVVLYSAGYHVLWHANTNGTGADRMVMQGDGNLVVYAGGAPKWWSGTSGSGFYAVLQGDGNFVVYTASGQAQWHTHTGGRI
jgi:surface antigen